MEFARHTLRCYGMDRPVVYVSKVKIIRDRGPIRRAFLPGQPEPALSGARPRGH